MNDKKDGITNIDNSQSEFLLSLNEMDILTHKSKISKELADRKAQEEYKKYDIKRREIESVQAEENFTKEIRAIKQVEKKD